MNNIALNKSTALKADRFLKTQAGGGTIFIQICLGTWNVGLPLTPCCRRWITKLLKRSLKLLSSRRRLNCSGYIKTNTEVSLPCHCSLLSLLLAKICKNQRALSWPLQICLSKFTVNITNHFYLLVSLKYRTVQDLTALQLEMAFRL